MKKSKFYFTSILFLIVNLIIAQNKSVYSNVINKKLLINDSVEFKVVSVNDNLKSEIFTFIGFNKKLKYLLMITKKKDSINFYKKKDVDEFKTAYLQKCNCEIEAFYYWKFHRFLSYRIKIKMIKNNSILYGYVDNFMMNNNLYSFLFLAPDIKSFEDFKEEYELLIKLFDNNSLTKLPILE